jgi:osmotically-inducible protein OsmY
MPRKLQRIAASTLVALAAGPLFSAYGMADTALVASVTEALHKSLGDSVKNVQVTSADGTVTLNGWVGSPKQEAQARKIASDVPGTAKVYSRLRTWSSADLD